MNHLMEHHIHVLLMENNIVSSNFEHVSVDDSSSHDRSPGSRSQVAVLGSSNLRTTDGMCVKVHKHISCHSIALEDRGSRTIADFADTGAQLKVTRNRVLDLESCSEVVDDRRKKVIDKVRSI